MIVLFDNISLREDLTPGWGFSAYLESPEHRILFDTGTDGAVLLSNMAKLSVDPKSVDLVVLSHNHGDHTGGLVELLDKNQAVTVYLGSSFPASFRNEVREKGAQVLEITAPQPLGKDVYTTGELTNGTAEQALILKTKEGLVMLTGCAHPGIVNMVRRAKEYLELPIDLVGGGFHLSSLNRRELKELVEQLQGLAVRRIAPSHCTGQRAEQFFQQTWGGNFVRIGCGAQIPLEWA